MGIPEELSRYLEGSPNPWEIEAVQTIGSTNSELSVRFSNYPAAPWLILWAEEQTEGRGRLKRSWFSMKGQDITASVLFPSPVKSGDVPKISICAGIALTNVLNRDYGLDGQVRWPNDVLINGLKVAGILCSYLSAPNGIVCGIGINANSDRHMPEIDRDYTTLSAETGTYLNRTQLFARWLLEFEKSWTLAKAEEIENLRATFERTNYYLDREVRILPDAGYDRDSADVPGQFSGIAKGLSESGALVIVKRTGEEYLVDIDDVIIPL